MAISALHKIDLMVREHVYETSPLRQVAEIMMIGAGSYKFYIEDNLAGAEWEDEEIDDPDETDTQKYSGGEINTHNLMAYPKISRSVLEDSVINLEDKLMKSIAKQFMLSENKAFILGNSLKQPRGLQYYAGKSADAYDRSQPFRLERVSVAKADFNADTLLNLEAQLLSAYKMNAHYLISRALKNTIRQFKDENGQYLFSTSQGWGGANGVPQIREGLHGRIFGYPIVECDDLPTLEAGNYPIYFGDFSGYCIADRMGLFLIKDEITKKGFIRYWMRKRLGAGLTIAQGIKALRIT